MTKIAIITNILPPYRAKLFNEISLLEGIDLNVYFMADNEKNRKWTFDASNISFKYKVMKDYGIDLSAKSGFIIHFNPHIIREIRKENYDIIIVSGYDSVTSLLAFLVSKFKKIPFVLWSGSTNNEKRLLRKIWTPVIKIYCKFSNAFLVYGTNAKKFLIANGAKNEDIFEAYNTVDISYYSDEARKYSGLRNTILKSEGISEQRIILYVGQLVDRKGIKTLIEAFYQFNTKIKDAALVIIGNGTEKNNYYEYCSDLELKNVYFLGYKTKNELPKYYSIADLFVLPSLREVWGLVINEAMACGLPIVTTNVVGSSEDLVIDGKNGYIITPSNSEEMAFAMEQILNSNYKMDEMGLASRNIIQKYTIENSANGFKKVIDFLLK